MHRKSPSQETRRSRARKREAARWRELKRLLRTLDQLVDRLTTADQDCSCGGRR